MNFCLTALNSFALTERVLNGRQRLRPTIKQMLDLVLIEHPQAPIQIHIPTRRIDRVLLVIPVHIVVRGLRQQLINTLALAQHLQAGALTRVLGKALARPGRVQRGQESARDSRAEWPERLQQAVAHQRHQQALSAPLQDARRILGLEQ